MRLEELYVKLVVVYSFSTLAGCIVPGSILKCVIDDPEDCYDLYPYANISITYEDENGKTHTEASVTGKYGDGIVAPFQGIGVHVRERGLGALDHTGCSSPLVVEPKPKEPWVAVVKRGVCEFAVKLHNAWAAKAAGVLIYDDVNNTNLMGMIMDDKEDGTISAVLSYKWKGEQIAKLIDSGKRVFISVTKVDNKNI